MRFMFCPKCGAYNSDENLWCVKCGYGLNEIPSAAADAGAERAEEKNRETPPRQTVYHASQIPNKPKKIKDYLIPSILVAVFCSVAFGAAAIIFSGMTQAELYAGSSDKAEAYSAKSRMFCWIGFAVGVVKLLTAAAFFIAAAFSASMRFYPYFF